MAWMYLFTGLKRKKKQNQEELIQCKGSPEGKQRVKLLIPHSHHPHI